MLSNLWNSLKSRKLAYYLIVVLTIEVLLGAVLPQEQFAFSGFANLLSRFPQVKQFTQLLSKAGLLPFFSSWLFIGTMILFFLNLLCCTIEQTAKAIHRQKGLAGSWGVVIFHLSLLLIILGTILTQALKFEGNFIIAEGQTWSNRQENYINKTTGPWFRFGMLSEFQLFLEKFSAVYPAQDFPQQLKSEVLLESVNVTSWHTVQVVKPLRFKGITIYQSRHGYAPELVMLDPSGQVLLEAAVSLNTDLTNGEAYLDELSMPETGLQILLRFLPDFRQDGPDKFSSRSFEPINPGMEVTVRDSGNKVVFQGPLILGKTINFQGYTLKFHNYRHWSGLTAVFDPGYPVIFAGFILGTFGLLCMFYLKDRKE